MHVIQLHALAPAVWDWPEPNRQVSSSEICPDIRVERKLVLYPGLAPASCRTTRRARSTALTVSRERECNEKGAEVRSVDEAHPRVDDKSRRVNSRSVAPPWRS
jgi:hypothetical protein